MTPGDHVVLTVWHWVAGFVITGGGGAAILTWWLSQNKKKKMSSPDHPHKVLHNALQSHIEEDGAKFVQVNNLFEKQFSVLMDIKEDIGKIKGKMNII